MKLLKIRKKESKKEEILPEIPVLAKDQIGITIDAKEKIIKAIKDKGLTDGYLRIALSGGGCSGLTLTFSLTNELKEKDQIFSLGEAKICIDDKSLKILGGSTLHVKDDLGIQEFVLVNNPAQKQCSCGKSFSF